MTFSEFTSSILKKDLYEIDNYFANNINEVKLVFSQLELDNETTTNCIDLLKHVHSNRRNGSEKNGIQFLITNLAFYFKKINRPEFVQTCITNLKDNVLKYRLQAWFQYKFEYRQSQSHISRFEQYLLKLSKAIDDENEDYFNDVLSDLYEYYNEYKHIDGLISLFTNQELQKKYSFLEEFNLKINSLEFKIELHDVVDKIFSPSVISESLFQDIFISYIKNHPQTKWNSVLLGFDKYKIRSEIIQFGQANFDKPYDSLSSLDVVKLYCYFNMRKHFFSSLYLFERCQWLLNLAQRKGNIHFIDIGCGPGTSGIALVDYFHSNSMNNRYFYYSGVDCYDSMLNCAKEFLSHRSIDNLTTTEFVKNLSSINFLTQHNINSIIINTCYLFASPSLDVSTIANEMNKIFDSKPDTPKFLLYQNTTEIEKNRKYNLFKTLINPFETLLSENVSIKYNNQRNSYYTPVSETVYIEVLKF